jgi:hypothetical protein
MALKVEFSILDQGYGHILARAMEHMNEGAPVRTTANNNDPPFFTLHLPANDLHLKP